MITKKIISFFIIIVLSVLMIACNQKKHSEVLFTTLSDKQYTLSSLQGKWIILNYWASWCAPCYQEVPELNKFAKKYQEQAMVFGVNRDLVSPQQLSSIVKKMNIQFIILKNDPGIALGINDIPGLPATYIFNDKGKLVKTLLGAQTEASLIKSLER
jgi:thiol-disulfide isomerase/thioredoxin